MSDCIINVENVNFTYRMYDEKNEQTRTLEGINTKINKGEFVVILGRNGSGKSTFARILNALLIPDDGVVYISGLRTDNAENIWEIRRSAGMIFQNPDNQIVGTIVEEDVAFGPENLGVPPEEIRQRVNEAIKIVGISEYSKHAPHLLSGGQKQRVAIAGILAMKPKCIILDEATSMLDPVGRKEVMQVLGKLNKEEKITVIHITHHMDEASIADRVIIIDKGTIKISGTPREVFSNVEKVKEMGLDVPQVTELFFELGKHGYDFPEGIMDIDEAYEILVEMLSKKR